MVGDSISVIILQPIDVRCIGYNESITPRHDSVWEIKTIGEHDTSFMLAIGILIAEEDYFSGGEFAVFDSGRVARVFDNVQVAPMIKCECDGIKDSGFGRDKFDMDVAGMVQSRCGLIGRNRCGNNYR